MEPPQQEAGVAAAEDKPKADVVTLLRVRDQMKQQLLECDAALHTGQENHTSHINEEADFKNTTQDLERDIEDIKVSFENKTLALQRIHLMVALRKKLMQNDDDSRLIAETMMHIIMLSSTVIEYQKQVREKEEKLTDIKRKRLLLKKSQGNTLLQLLAVMKKEEKQESSTTVSEMLESLRNNLEKERKTTTVIQNVFQNIIIGSRANWAEDPTLKAAVLQLEKNVYYM